MLTIIQDVIILIYYLYDNDYIQMEQNITSENEMKK